MSLLLGYVIATFTKREIMKTTIFVQNLKCSGCANTITTKLQNSTSAEAIEIDVLNGSVTFQIELEDAIPKVKEVLCTAGYPEVGTSNTIATQAKSFVSCAIGKMS